MLNPSIETMSQDLDTAMKVHSELKDLLTRNGPCVIPVIGYSGVGKTTLSSLAAEVFGGSYYHIAKPFKEMLGVLWPGVDVDDKEQRSIRPTDGKTVGELMADAFLTFKAWDPNLLYPRLVAEIREHVYEVSYMPILIDGVRTQAELDRVRGIADYFNVPCVAWHIYNPHVLEESHPQIAPHIDQVIDTLMHDPDLEVIVTCNDYRP